MFEIDKKLSSLNLIFKNQMQIQGRHGRFLAEKTTIVAATSAGVPPLSNSQF
jgi:hypothetical protein